MNNDEYQLLMKMMLEMKEIGIRNTVVLEEHARRSTASEARLALQEEKMEKLQEHFDKRMEPIEDHIKFYARLFKGAASLLALAGVVATIVEVVRQF